MFIYLDPGSRSSTESTERRHEHFCKKSLIFNRIFYGISDCKASIEFIKKLKHDSSH